MVLYFLVLFSFITTHEKYAETFFSMTVKHGANFLLLSTQVLTIGSCSERKIYFSFSFGEVQGDKPVPGKPLISHRILDVLLSHL